MKMKNGLWVLVIVCLILLAGCSVSGIGSKNAESEETDKQDDADLIVIGFSQVGAESDWRKASTESMKETFTRENGYELIFSDAQQKQTNQITAIRTFIQQGVDYIVLAPVTEDGWDTVLGEAKDAGIPIIIVDRMVNSTSSSLFRCWVGSDFRLEGLKVVNWLNQYLEVQGIEPSSVNIVNIKGTEGASSQIGRTAGIQSGVRKYGWKLLGEGDGEYTQARAREVMAQMLDKYDTINVVYCENDNEAFGAIEAIEASGRKVGSDIMNGEIMILSFDGVSEQAIEYAKEGKISCIGECNPLHGPRVKKIIEALENGETPQKYEYVDESILSSITAVKSVKVDDSEYPVTLLQK